MTSNDDPKGSWNESKDLLRRALALPPEERDAFLSDACADDTALLSKLRQLIAGAEQTDAGLRALVAEAAVGVSQDIAVDHSGRQIGPYSVIRRIGEGGMGDVYLAERADNQYRQQVAIKILKPGRDEQVLIQRFRSERQILADLDHPNIGRLIDGGEMENGRPYLVMEYVDGTPITEYCDQNGLDTKQRLRLFLQCCAAVSHAHKRLVNHRDLKPSNILVDAAGTPKLLDFGIAKLLDPQQQQHSMAITRDASRPMTPGHASPEQIRGETPTTATDIYSLGVLLYQLLSGRFPYQLTSHAPSELEQAILTTQPTKPSVRLAESDDADAPSVDDVGRHRGTSVGRLRKELAGDLDNIVMVAMRKEAERRYSTVGDLAADIRSYLEFRPVTARADSVSYRLSRFIRRNRVGVGVTAVVIAGITLQTAFYTRQIQAERDTALTERQTAESVSAFLVDLFNVANPIRGDDSTMTARDILDNGVEKIQTDLDGDPVVKARLLRTMGDAYSHLAYHDKAEAVIRDAIAIYEVHAEPTDDELLDSLEILSSVLRSQEQWDDARNVAQRALSIREALVGKDDPSLHSSLAVLGNIHHYLDELDEALALYERIIEIENNAFSKDDPAKAKAINHAALTYERMGRYAEAEAAYRESLRLREKGYGKEHARTAFGQSNLGIFLSNQGRHDAAEPYLLTALEVRRKIYGDDNINVAYPLTALSNIEVQRGNLTRAAEYQEQVKSIWFATNPSHGTYANAVRSLGRLYGQMDRFEEALAETTLALELYREIYGEKNSRVAESLHTIAEVHYWQGTFEEAQEFEALALAMRREVLKPGHLALRNSLELSAKIHLELGDLEAAKRFMDEVLAMSAAHDIDIRMDYLNELAEEINLALAEL